VKNGNTPTTFSAGELARELGVSTDTLRHYESKGVIARPPRQTNGYRAYPAEVLPRLQLVRAALTLGFTLDELAEILKTRDSGGAPCRKVRQLAGAKLESIEARIKELTTLRDTIRITIREWDARLAVTPANKPCRLLEALPPNAARRPNGNLFVTTQKTPSPGQQKNK
jgi:DNA-binding transcriptional MerR regulator